MFSLAKSLGLFLFFGLSLMAFNPPQESGPAPSTDAGAESPQLNPELVPYLEYLNEFTDRRRMNVYFRNDQPQERGAQAGYVNVGQGNFTFLRRDLVAVGRIPLVLARVYDSSLPEGGGFGPGWRLTAAETIRLQEDGSLIYIDESAAGVRFVPSRKGYVRATPGPSDVRTIVAYGADRMKVILRSGWTKLYSRMEGLHRLTRVEDRWGNRVDLEYEQGRLSLLRGPSGRRITLGRDDSGRVVSALDEQGRGVSYSYDEGGRLIESRDLGGFSWRYAYDSSDRLSKVVDALGQNSFIAAYDEQGRASEVASGGQLYRYHYQPGRTLVTDGNEAVCVYGQNEAGITVEISNSVGVSTRVELDAGHRPQALYRNGELWAEFSHDRRGRLAMLTRYEGGKPEQLLYRYDKMGRLTRVQGGIDSYGWGLRDLLRLSYDRSGNLALRWDENGRTDFAYNDKGDLESIAQESFLQAAFEHDSDGQIVSVTDAEGRRTRFQYRPDGKLARTFFADGSEHSYDYDRLGMRTRRQMRNGEEDQGSVDFISNATGSLINTSVLHADGRRGGHRLVLDDEQKITRIEYSSGHATDLEYDAMGNVVLARSHDDMAASFSYDRLNRLTEVVTAENERLSYVYRQGEADIRVQHDRKTGVRPAPAASVGRTFGSGMDIVRDHSRRSYLGAVDLSGSALEFRLASAYGLALPDQAADSAVRRMRLLDLGPADGAAKDRFELPSNIFFHPAEYRAINCCVECDIYGICPPCRPHMPCDCGIFCDCDPIIIPFCTFTLNVTSPQNFRISTAPAMPTITVSATNKFPSNAQVALSAKIDYSSPGGACSGGPDFNTPTIIGVGESFNPNFGGFFGGRLTASGTCVASGAISRTLNKTEDIEADDPSGATIRGGIGTVGAPFQAADLQRIACHESGQRQFVNGLPLLGGGGDVGIMQICFQRQARHFWNWRDNVATGRVILNSSLNFANSVPGRVRTQTVRGMGPFPSATNFSNAQARLEAIHAYNAGNNINTDGYWQWNNTLMQWVAAPQGGAPGYVGNVTGSSPICR